MPLSHSTRTVRPGPYRHLSTGRCRDPRDNSSTVGVRTHAIFPGSEETFDSRIVPGLVSAKQREGKENDHAWPRPHHPRTTAASPTCCSVPAMTRRTRIHSEDVLQIGKGPSLSAMNRAPIDRAAQPSCAPRVSRCHSNRDVLRRRQTAIMRLSPEHVCTSFAERHTRRPPSIYRRLGRFPAR